MTSDSTSAIQLAVHDWFFVGGDYVSKPEGTFLTGQMYVERFVPEDCRHKEPVVMIHGGVQTAANFIATPDSRRGWLHDFLAAGYAVYLVDQPERGRSGHALQGADAAKMFRYPAERIETVFTASGNAPLWPQAKHHTQWPGAGVRGDAVFDRFFASQVEQLANRDEIERLTRDACVALLEDIGAAIILTHSQSGPFGWLIADARPDLVKAILAIEPNGPPFRDIQWVEAPEWYAYGEEDARAWGITRLPMTFDPPAAAPADLAPQLTPPPAADLA
ncbi:MAG: alpha/beta hydrolase, partial [Alphaproteobacteria bacterium]